MLITLGAFISSVGAVTGNKWLQVAGMVLSMGVNFYTNYTAIIAGATAEVATEVAQNVVIETAQGLIVSQLSSLSFAEMTFSTFMELFNLYRTVTSALKEETKEEKQKEEEELGISVKWKMYGEDEDNIYRKIMTMEL